MTELEFKILLNEKLCDLADDIMYYYNPCKIENGKCLLDEFCCSRTRFKRQDGKEDCHFLKDGCTFKNLKCKLWFCETAIKNMSQECLEIFKNLENIAKLHGLTRKPFLGESYVGRQNEIHNLQNSVKDN